MLVSFSYPRKLNLFQTGPQIVYGIIGAELSSTETNISMEISIPQTWLLDYTNRSQTTKLKDIALPLTFSTVSFHALNILTLEIYPTTP